MKIPKLDKYINDFSKVLSKQAHHELNESAATIEREHSFQVVTVMFPHRQGRELKDIALEVFNENGIGQKGKNNGLLLIISSEEKKIRIMVGKGLEWIFTEGWCRYLIEKKLRPLLKEGKYDELLSEWHSQIRKGNNPQNNPLNQFLGLFSLSAAIPLMLGIGITLGSIGNKILFFVVVGGVGLIIFSVIKKQGRFWKLGALILCIILLCSSYFSYKNKIYCEQNSKICEQRKIEAEKRRQQRESSSKYKSSHSSSDWSSSSDWDSGSSFDGGGGSTNGAGWGD